jgi:YD repeat-containing protein
MRHLPLSFRSLVAATAVVVAAVVSAGAITGNQIEGALRASPVLRDAAGQKIADGNFVQSVENDGLHVQITYTGSGRRMEETAVLRQRPELSQSKWGWRESAGGKEVRTFAVDFDSGMATAVKTENGEPRRWSEKLDITPGQTFAGFGFTLAIKALRERLIKGETVNLKAIGFTPQPREVTVAISYAGRESIRMADGSTASEHYIIHPKVPALAKWFVKAPDANVWLTPPPAVFVRFQGALVEPSDPIIRIDSGTGESAAAPRGTSGNP